MLHAMTLHLLWVLKFRVYSNTPALDLFSKPAVRVSKMVLVGDEGSFNYTTRVSELKLNSLLQYKVEGSTGAHYYLL